MDEKEKEVVIAKMNGGAPTPFSVRPQSFGFDPHIDLNRINQLVDALESAETAKKLANPDN